MSKAKLYSTNVTGQNLIIRAFSVEQVAQYFGEPVQRLRPWISICGPSVVRQADIDLTENPPNNGLHPTEYSG